MSRLLSRLGRLGQTRTLLFAVGSASCTAGVVTVSRDGQAESVVTPTAVPPAEAGSHRAGLPEYTAADVRLHDGKQARSNGKILVSYKDGVYDITSFVNSHPGGSHIMLAAGGSIEPFWDMYSQHKEEFVYELLEEMRVGNLASDGRDSSVDSTAAKSTDPYAADPARHPALLVRSEKPFNAEPPPGLLVATQRTPNEIFYVRNHLPVPVVDVESYRLEVCDARGVALGSYSLEELKQKFRSYTVDASIQCAGNRRNEMSNVKSVKGGAWDYMAISNASWTGVRLRDVLGDSGVDVGNFGNAEETNKTDLSKIAHVQFEGLDADPLTKQSYGASVPIDVVQRVPDVLLAFEMNGETLPRDHGFPLRAIVPGIVGARQVKWVGKVSLSEDESLSHWQRNDYKGFCPSVDWDTVDFTAAPAIQELPVVSAICSQVVNDDGSVTVKGYAWSGDGKGIIRVDVSGDGGNTWQVAELLPRSSECENSDSNSGRWNHRRNQIYDWTRWSAEVKGSPGSHGELVCKAVDSSYQTQPERVESIWNLRGVLNNSWHRVSFRSSVKTEP